MKAIMVMYDSLRWDLLEAYGCDWTLTPNFKRLAEHSVQFENSWAGSLPCMPARRELHTGRYNFLHRSWGPIEPFDDSMPEILKKNGIHSHLVSDHQHYWEDGGATYHTRYSTWDISRGQEGDPWQADLSVSYDRSTVFKGKEKMFSIPGIREIYAKMMANDERNRKWMDTEEKTSQAYTFNHGLEFIDTNHDQDSWFLQIETFDPHEPFYTLPSDREKYPYEFVGDAEMDADWPPYMPCEEDEETVKHVRYDYAALLTKCDMYLGKVLDKMDEYDLWKDTMLIVNTDHGFLLSEHGWWGKTSMPLYSEISHIPLFVYDPRFPEAAGTKSDALVQTIDIAPTVLEYFGLEIPKDMEGRSMRPVIEKGEGIRDYALLGYHGSQVCITDGRWFYMHSAENPDAPVYEYTLMPTHMRSMFQPAELQDIELAGPFSFTKGCKVMKIKSGPQRMGDTTKFGSALYDLSKDRMMEHPVENAEVVASLKAKIRELMETDDAPAELYDRLGL